VVLGIFHQQHAYDDEITFSLAQAVADEMNIALSDVFITFGEWWVITTSEKYRFNEFRRG
jgi:hypothetical protein